MTTARNIAARLSELLRREHGFDGRGFLVALAEFDRQRSWEQLGYASLFHFLHRRLSVSRSSAHFRKTAAVLVQRFPDVVEPLRDGRLCITSIVELAKVLTEENRADVLPRFFHCSKQEARAVAVDISRAVWCRSEPWRPPRRPSPLRLRRPTPSKTPAGGRAAPAEAAR